MKASETQAEEIARRIWAEDEASRWLGMQLEEVRAGYARVSMPVTERMVNAQKLCHGGLITAEAAEVAHAGRSRHYDVRVTE